MHSIEKKFEHSLGPTMEWAIFLPHKVICLYYKNGEAMQKNASISFYQVIGTAL